MSGSTPTEKRFEDFFAEEKYVVLKNSLYNYLVRRRVINRALGDDAPDMILEVGSGLSPIVTGTNRIVYSELSFRALQTLKRRNCLGYYVVADGTRLPFANDSISHTVCSEVLEHVENDTAAIAELARVTRPDGRVLITVPHRKFYFAADDRFVHHFRRYEVSEMQERLARAGLRVRSMRKVLGPLEKVTMLTTVMAFSALQRIRPSKRNNGTSSPLLRIIEPLFRWGNLGYSYLAQADARVMPRALATVLLFEATKDASGGPARAENA